MTTLARLVALSALALVLLPDSANAYVYWSDPFANTIGRANLDGNRAKPSFITGASSPRGIAVDASHLYWANQSTGTIGRADLDGSNVNQDFITGASGPRGIAVDSGHIYWSNGPGAIGRADLDGSNVDQDFIIYEGGIHSPPASRLAIATSTGRTWAASSAVPTSTAPTWTSSSCRGSSEDVAVDANHIYWSGSGTPTIGRADLDGDNVDSDFIDGASAGGLAVDSHHLYWANSAGTLGRVDLDGLNANASFLAGLDNPYGLAVDALVPPPRPRLSLQKARRLADKTARYTCDLANHQSDDAKCVRNGADRCERDTTRRVVCRIWHHVIFKRFDVRATCVMPIEIVLKRDESDPNLAA